MTGITAALAASGVPRITLADGTTSSSGLPNQTATYTLEADGDIITATTAGGSTDAGDWIAPKAAAGGNYEVKATIVSGSVSSGTTGSWLALSSDRTWTRSRVTTGTDTLVLTIEIRRTGTTTVLATCTRTLVADKG